MSVRGEPGKPGQPGEQGEQGKDTGEGGRGGEGGLGGGGGAGAPQGPGGGGGVGGEGGRGARGEQGAPGERGADGTQPKLRWAPAVGYVLLAVVLGFLIWRTQSLANAERAQLVAACEARNDQSVRSKEILLRFAAAEQEENEDLAGDYAALARRATDPERRRFLLLLGQLELKRDRATASLFRELAANVRVTDCQVGSQQ